MKSDIQGKIVWCRLSVIALGFLLAVSTTACAQKYSDEEMQPLAATTSDLARAVMRYAMSHPAEATSLNDMELVQKATAHDPNLLAPYKGYTVRGNVGGIILVCSGDTKRGLIEDAECTDKVDRMVWLDESIACDFTLKVETVCPALAK